MKHRSAGPLLGNGSLRNQTDFPLSRGAHPWPNHLLLVPPKPFSPSSGGDGDGRGIGNSILRALPRKELTRVLPSAEFVRLKLHQVLHEPGEAIKSVYFLNNGLGSVLTTQPDRKTVEVGLIGREGFVGLPVIFGLKTSGLRVVTQADATAWRRRSCSAC